MADPGRSDGNGRRRNKKNRARQGGPNKRKRSKGRGNRGNHQAASYVPEPIRDENSILGSRVIKPQEKRAPQPSGPPDAFALFCSYYLGITPDDTYHKPDPEHVARRYGMTHDALKKMLVEFGIDEASLRESRFDLEGAKLDVRVAPQGISRTEIARDLFEELMASRNDDATE